MTTTTPATKSTWTAQDLLAHKDKQAKDLARELEIEMLENKRLREELKKEKEKEKEKEKAKPVEERTYKIREPQTFKGGDVRGWISHIEKYLRLGGVDKKDRVVLASYYLEGPVAKWWLQYTRREADMDWEEFTQLLKERYDDNNEFEKRKRFLDLRQTGTLKDYTDAFMDLMSEISDISEEDLVVRYVKGLKPKTSLEIELKNPQTLNEAMRMAVVLESKFVSNRSDTDQRNSTKNTPIKSPIKKEERSPFPTTPFKNDSIRKQLKFETPIKKCFKCGNPDHLAKDCPKKIQGVFQNKELLSLQGELEGEKATILVDSGSTENLIKEQFAKDNLLKVHPMNEKAQLADGKEVKLNGLVKGKLKMGELESNVNLKMTNLANYDVILGKPWLTEFNPRITWILS